MKTLFLMIIRGYQKVISPILPPHCRFHPTCSEYGYQAINKYGIFKGIWLAAIRVGKCHPFHEGGYDPVQ